MPLEHSLVLDRQSLLLTPASAWDLRLMYPAFGPNEESRVIGLIPAGRLPLDRRCKRRQSRSIDLMTRKHLPLFRRSCQHISCVTTYTDIRLVEWRCDFSAKQFVDLMSAVKPWNDKEYVKMEAWTCILIPSISALMPHAATPQYTC